MTDKPNDLDQSIQLALEAAAAANDTADEVARLTSDTQKAADRLDRFATTFRPVMFGVLAGAFLAIALGGLTYMRTLSEMRQTNATQIEALGIFTTTVRDLQASLSEIDALIADVETLKADQATLLQQFDETDAQPQDGAASTVITALITDQHTQTRETITLAASDLHMALARLIAQQPTAPAPVPAPAADPATSTQSAQPARRAPAPRSAPTVRPQARPVIDNPFSFP